MTSSSSHSLEWFVGVTTAPRSGPPLLAGTLESLRAAGWDGATIFAEPGTDLQGVLPEYAVHRNTKRLWTWENFLSCIRKGVESGSNKIAVVQDDLQIATGLRAYLDETITGKKAIWSPYTPGHGIDRIDAGWCEIPKRFMTSTYGACFYAMTIHTARLLLATLPRDTRRIGTDGWVSKWCLKEDAALMHHSPSLVQHVGHHSALSFGEDNDEYGELCDLRHATRFCEDAGKL